MSELPAVCAAVCMEMLAVAAGRKYFLETHEISQKFIL
jgi:hypothetical protein